MAGGAGTLIYSTRNEQGFEIRLRVSADALMHVLNEILDFSKVEAGKLSLEQIPFLITDCVQQAFQVIVPEAQRKNIKLNWQIEDDTQELVIGDPHRLYQVTLNLLSNGVKFTREGSGSQKYSLQSLVNSNATGNSGDAALHRASHRHVASPSDTPIWPSQQIHCISGGQAKVCE